jgi:hypothetical protein
MMAPIVLPVWLRIADSFCAVACRASAAGAAVFLGEYQSVHLSASDPRRPILFLRIFLGGREKNLDTISRIVKSWRNGVLHGAMHSVVMSG